MTIQPPIPQNQPKVRNSSKDLQKLGSITKELEAVRETDRLVRNHQQNQQLLSAPLDIFKFLIPKDEVLLKGRSSKLKDEDMTPEAATSRREKISHLERRKDKVEARLKAVKRLHKSLDKLYYFIEHDDRRIDDDAIGDYFLAEDSQYEDIQAKARILKPKMENIFARRG